MHRALAVLQAGIYAALSWEVSRRSAVDAGFLAAAALAQVGVLILWRRPRPVSVLAGLSLIGVLVPWARLFASAVHVKATVGPETAAQMLSTFGATAVVIPWVLVVPLTQLARHGWGRVGWFTPLALLPGILGPGLSPPARLDPLAFHPTPPRRTEVFPGTFLPAPPTDDRRWSEAPPLTPAAIDDALAAAVHHLAVNLGDDGRYTYIVKGPSGAAGSGYNYPRHAGTTWFLARVAGALAETRAPVAAEAERAARRALAHLVDDTTRTIGSRSFVMDPTRRDGKAWIGTTALAALALVALPTTPADLPVRDAWAAQLAASVDASGKVRGEMSTADGSFPDQPANPYGQGQTMLALAALDRAGTPGVRDALTRAAAFVTEGYYGTEHPLATGDEHWMCLAAHVLGGLGPTPGGRGVCASYVATERWMAPVGGGGLPPAAGPAGGAAEAVVAHAWDTRDPGMVDLASRYGRLFLQNQYRAEDAPLLGRPERLIGGFRDGAASLDVQIDAVQHIGCALLGVEAILSGRARPGSFP